MSDAELYGWDRAWAFHGIYLAISTGTGSMHVHDNEETLRYHQALVCAPSFVIPLGPYHHQDINKNQSAEAKSPTEFNALVRS